MTEKQVKIGNELIRLIDVTKCGIESIEKWIAKSKQPDLSSNNCEYDRDKNYNLTICEQKDGSGNSLNLSRYMGNSRMLEIIRDELISQLKTYKTDLENL